MDYISSKQLGREMDQKNRSTSSTPQPQSNNLLFNKKKKSFQGQAVQTNKENQVMGINSAFS
jgi:hypothetical protein